MKIVATEHLKIASDIAQQQQLTYNKIVKY